MSAAELRGARRVAHFEPRTEEGWRDPFTMYRDLRDHDPVHHVERGDYWVLSRYRHVFDAARDTERFSSAQGLTHLYDDVATAGLDTVRPMVFLDPPEHTEFRRLVAKGFTPRQVAEIEPAVREFAAERIESLRSNGGGDIVSELLKPLPTFVVAHYLGVPEADRGRFDRWVHRVVAASANGNVLDASETVAEIFEYFTALIERRRKEPEDDTEAADATGVAGVRVASITENQAPGRRVHEPHHPMADAEGYVTHSNVSVVDEMVNMISASRSYQNNVEVMNTARTLLSKTLQMGQ